jgi:chemotaxis protein MotB
MADAKEHPEIIIIKRHDDEEHEHHSSAWKVAHADFMTAMMAFFLIMWLINVTDEEVRKGISQYFNPLHITEGQTEHKGLNDPEAAKSETEALPGKAPPAKAKPGGGSPDQQTDEHASEQSDPGGGAGPDEGAPSGAPEAMPGDPASTKLAAGDLETVGPAEEATMDDRERAAFQDPYALLASLATVYKAKHPASADISVGDTRNEGLIGGAADRDPFDPIYWQTAGSPDVRATEPGAPGTNETLPTDAQLDAAGPEPAPPMPEAVADPVPPAPPIDVATAAEPGADAGTMAVAAEVGGELTTALQAALGNAPAPDISVTATSEGVLIDILDQENFSMFEIGSAIPEGRVVVVLEEVARVLGTRPGSVTIRGHTDGRPFRSPDYDNWRLSAARAHMAYYMLVRGGLAESRVDRIEGYADRDLKNPSDPNAAENRRIAILLREATP